MAFLQALRGSDGACSQYQTLSSQWRSGVGKENERLLNVFYWLSVFFLGLEKYSCETGHHFTHTSNAVLQRLTLTGKKKTQQVCRGYPGPSGPSGPMMCTLLDGCQPLEGCLGPLPFSAAPGFRMAGSQITLDLVISLVTSRFPGRHVLTGVSSVSQDLAHMVLSHSPLSLGQGSVCTYTPPRHTHVCAQLPPTHIPLPSHITPFRYMFMHFKDLLSGFLWSIEIEHR